MTSKHHKKDRKSGKLSPQQFGSYESKDNTLVRATVHGDNILTSDGSGNIKVAIPMDPSVINDTDWADFSSTYDEFRVMGVRITFATVSPNQNNASALMAVAFDNDSSGTPANYTAVRQYSTCRLVPAVTTVKPTVLTWWRPTRGVETNIYWADVANPSTSLGSIQIAVGALSVSTQYLFYTVDFFIEFRGRR